MVNIYFSGTKQICFQFLSVTLISSVTLVNSIGQPEVSSSQL